MAEPNEHIATEGPFRSQPRWNLAWAFLGLAGITAFALALVAVQREQFHVVTYTSVATQGVLYWPALLFGVGMFAGIVALACWAARPAVSERRCAMTGSILAPLILAAPAGCYAFIDAPPPFVLSFLMILSAGWTAFRAATCLGPVGPWLGPCRHWRWAHPVALGSIVFFIVILTVVHTRLQINFFEHFMLGHADFGHHTEELKNCLAGRGLRCDSFENTRLGVHFSPLLYALVPGYALFPSPVYLMVCGALLVHAAAVPAYYLARRLSGSAEIAWMFAVAWLLLPSQSRLPYANTYGFQWAYATLPLLGAMIASGVLGRWRTSLVLTVLVLFCRETASAATFAWGVYLALCTPRRKSGILVAIGSVAYLILCVQVFIPHFAAEGRYWRLDLFGELGGTLTELLVSPFTKADVFFPRLVREQVPLFLLILLVPMAFLPLRGWRVALASLPTLMLVLLIKHDDQLSIKFWHQASVLPFLFFAGVASLHSADDLTDKSGRFLRWLSGGAVSSGTTVNRGVALAALVCAAWGHYFFGFSPISKAYEPIANSTFLQTPDPRMQAVQHLRSEIPRDRTILASERLAAHFTDYKRLYTGGRMHDADHVIVDRSDTWDASGLVQDVMRFAHDPHYGLYGEYGSIIVFARLESAPPVPLDD